jgi:hypothetical protein
MEMFIKEYVSSIWFLQSSLLWQVAVERIPTNLNTRLCTVQVLH